MQARWILALLLATPLLAGCATPPEGETLQRADLPAGTGEAATPVWADLASATIRPGVDIVTPLRACPSNFVFTRPDNGAVFLGTSAYCVRDMPVGTLATIGGPENLAVLVYSSWETMQEKGEQDELALQYNDFAVFFIDQSSRRHVHPAMLHVGGPVAEADFAAVGLGDRVRAYANLSSPVGVSIANLSTDVPVEAPVEARFHTGIVTGHAGEWAYLAHALPPALPGNMGGGVLDEAGRAVGVMVNLGVVPNPGANGIARLDAVMRYAEEHANLYMRLATWDLLEPGVVPRAPDAEL